MTINKAILLGTAETNPQIHLLPTGTRVANFTLATIERWKDGKTGLEKSRTERHKIAVFSDKLIDIIKARVKEGALLYIEGQIENRTWLDPQNVSRSTIDIVVRPARGLVTILDGGENEPKQPSFAAAI